MGSSSALMNTLNTNNLEMPLFMFAYDYGIISTVLIYALIFINPLIIVQEISLILASLFNNVPSKSVMYSVFISFIPLLIIP